MKAKRIVLGAALILAPGLGAGLPEGIAQMKDHAGMPMQMQAAGIHKGTGIVNGVDVEKGTVNLSHEPIESLKWPKMTMDLEVADKVLLQDLKPGMKVDFELGKKRAGGYAITSIREAR